MAGLAFALFHLNICFSSIEISSRKTVIDRCYWPLLDLARRNGPIGIEASGYTLEAIQALAPDWIRALRELVAEGKVELIGSGYSQLIGPLVPSRVNRANLDIARQVYSALVGCTPSLALVNEQSVSGSLISEYIDAGYCGIIMEWDNPRQANAQWNSKLQYLPQRALASDGRSIPLIWNNTFLFQKFQRFVHHEISWSEYSEFVDRFSKQAPPGPYCLCLYSNDAEIFDFRPGRFAHEPPIAADSEWGRIDQVFSSVGGVGDLTLVAPSAVLDLLDAPNAGQELTLASAAHPTPTKKQQKYNILRWAVTGRFDLEINTRCARLSDRLEQAGGTPEQWKELCYLWSSDFRTHITEERWQAYRARLASFEAAMNMTDGPIAVAAIKPVRSNRPRDDRFLRFETDAIGVILNSLRGLAIERMWIPGDETNWLCGTTPHGLFDDIAVGADFYTGNLVHQAPGTAQVTDLESVMPQVGEDDATIVVSGAVETPLGPITKIVTIHRRVSRIDIDFRLDWEKMPIGLLRLGYVTLNPDAFERRSLRFSCRNGGSVPDVFSVGDDEFDHGRPVSYLVSANAAVALSDGRISIGDDRYRILVECDRSRAAMVGLVKYKPLGNTYFFSFCFTANEVDDTAVEDETRKRNGQPLVFRVSLTAEVSGDRVRLPS